MTLTTRELRLAAKAAKPFLPVTLEEVIPTKPKSHLPPGVFKHGHRFRCNIRQPDGRFKLTSFATPEEASKARLESLNLNNP